MRANSTCRILLGVVLLCWANTTTAASSEPAKLLFADDFEEGALTRWSGPALVEPGVGGGRCVVLDCKSAGAGATIYRQLPLEKLKGLKIRVSARVKAQEVTQKPNAWNGIKLMLIVEGPAGRTYPQASLGTGSFDWQTAAFTARIPTASTNVAVVLGLERVSGKVWFDDLQVAGVGAPQADSAPAAIRYKGHQLPRLRGAMISPDINASGLMTLGKEWGANLVRWQLIRHDRPGALAALDTYDAWLEKELSKLDAGLPVCRESGMLVVVDLHSPPGGRGTVSGYVGSDSGLFTDQNAQARLMEVWRKIAKRYRGNDTIWGFDLANEPVEEDVGEGCLDWQQLAEKAAQEVNRIDPKRTLIVEPADWGGPEAIENLRPIAASNVVYSVHMYVPHAFTHQNVHNTSPPLLYPGLIDGRQWDKAALARALDPVVQFQRKYNVHIYIGEFSAIRWAPDESAFRYLQDLIQLFEANGWDWSYHAFREWNGWSVEHGPDKQDGKPAQAVTSRQKLLREYFGKNQKPGGKTHEGL